MPKNVLKESQLRQIVKVMLEDKTLGPAMVKVNPVVDPSAAKTDPSNPDYKPNSKVELQIALSTMIEDLPADNISVAYDAIKDALDKNEEEIGKAQMTKSNEKIEETIRLAIRKMLSEAKPLKEYYAKDPKTGEMVWKGAGPAPKLAASASMKKLDPSERGIAAGPKTPAVKALRKSLEAMKDLDMDATDTDQPALGRGRKNIMMTDVEGASFDEIAKELGFSHPSGAKGAVVKALEKAKFVGELMDQDELEILVLQSMNDYVDMLSGTGELTPADVKLLKDHPDIVRELDGFREYLDKSIRSMKKAKG